VNFYFHSSHYFVDTTRTTCYTVFVVKRDNQPVRRRFIMFESNELNVGDLIKFDGNGLSPNYDTIVKVRPKSVITIGSGIVKIKNIIWTVPRYL